MWAGIRTTTGLLCAVLLLEICSGASIAAKTGMESEPVCTADGTCTNPAATQKDPWASLKGLEKGEALVEWIQSMEGGFVATDLIYGKKTSIGSEEPVEDENPDDLLNPDYDFVASQDIEKGTVLMEIPEEAMLGGILTDTQSAALKKFMDSPGVDQEKKIYIPMCMAIEAIAYEGQKGPRSKYHPYLQFVFGEGNPEGKKPSDWSDMGQFLFWGIVGSENTLYAPDKEHFNIVHNEACREYLKLSERSQSPVEAGPDFDEDVWEDNQRWMEHRAYSYFTRHAWGTNFIPVFDMISHGNGNLRNVEAKYVDVETNEVIPIEPRTQRFEGFKRRDESSPPKKIKLVVYAHRDIREGETLRVSYNQCEHLGCEKLSIDYTASDIFGHFGIIEEYPRRWSFKIDPDETFKSDYYFVFDIHLDPETQEKTFHLVQSTHPEEEIYKLGFLGRSVTRWRLLEAELDEHMAEGTEWHNTLESIRDEYENEYIYKFYYAYMEAIELAWKHRHDKVKVNSKTAVIETAVSEVGTTQNVMEGYDDLSGPKGPTVKTRGSHLACAEGEYADEGALIGSAKGFYQTLEYFYERKIDNTYMRMATWLHSASNFRAHYHEGVIHVALQYVKEPKRVAYIGGGDNMVLAEVLKYPGIEKVVGMELDQQACRSSMRYFGTSPNYHDDRVEWWYGNGALALQLLPEDYFGSFDLVLVDLLNDVSEAIRVTADLSLADVAPLLVNPNGGVLARNEDQVDRSEVTTRLANRVVMYDYFDCPRLCEVSMSIASNSVDFAKGPRYDHNISTVTRLKNFTNDAYDGWARYYDSTTTASTTQNPATCKKMQRALLEEQQPSSGGVFMVIEAENVTESLEVDNLPRLHQKIEKIAKDYGLSPISSAHEPKSNVHSFVLLCKQGYIQMQTHPQFQYVGFDLSLWGGNAVIDKTEEIQRALVAAVGGGNLEGSVSTYRISTGGMGTEKEDHVDNGLVKKALEYYCGSDSGSSNTDSDGEKPADDDEKTLNEEDQLMNDSSILLNEILMGVTAKKANEQPAFAVFCGKKADGDCERYSSASFHPVYSCESFVDMQGCELETAQNLQDIVSEHKLLDGFVLDRSVSLEMGKVLHKVFNNTLHQANFLEDSFAALTPGSEDSWRNILLDRFRTEIIIANNVEKADFEISNGSLSELWSVVSIQNKNFYGNLQDSLAALEEKTGFTTITRKIVDSMIPIYTDWLPDNPKDLDFFNQAVMDQWLSQRPVANQYVLQMQVDSQPDPPEVGERVLIGNKFIRDGVHGGEAGFLFEHFEGTIVEVNGRNRYVAETKPFIAKNGAIQKFEHAFANNATKEIPRRQIRRISKTETDRIFDVGDLVLANQVHNETQERMPNAWYAAIVMGISEEGVSVRPKDYKDSYHPLQQTLPFEDVWVWNESPEFLSRKAGVSLKTLQEAFEKSIGVAELAPKDSYANLGTVEVGKGYIMSFVSSKGSGIMKWDGADRVEVNILVTEGDFREDFDSEIRSFSLSFLKLLPSLTLIGKDSFPRGYGKVVNFQHEMDWEEKRRRNGNIDYKPHWMNAHLPESEKLDTPDYYYVGSDFVDFSRRGPINVEEEEDDYEEYDDEDEEEEEE